MVGAFKELAIKLIAASFLILTADLILPDKPVYRSVRSLLYLIETLILIEPLTDLFK